jgi:hypothetical protein
MDVLKSQRTAWGKRTLLEDVRALRTYNALLKRARTVGETLAVCFSAATILGALAFMYLGNFESAIVNDGTSTNCVLDDKTGSTTHGK